MTAGETHQAIETTFRIERARLIAGLARVVRNVDLAEEPAQDALVVAVSEWPRLRAQRAREISLSWPSLLQSPLKLSTRGLGLGPCVTATTVKNERSSWSDYWMNLCNSH
jgi:hypothetical protein